MTAASAALLLATVVLGPSATTPVTVASAAAFRSALRSARPGTHILVAAGDYHGYFSAANLHGTPDAPIVVEAADPAHPPVFHGAGGCIHLSRVSHITLRNLVLVRARMHELNIDDGGVGDSPSHHVVLDGLTVRDNVLPGNRDGIKLSGVDDFLIRRCVVERWGSGGSAIDMVGCHRGLITQCEFRHNPGQGATGVQAKGGSRAVVVHKCRFQSAGQRAINMGGFSASGYLRPRKPGYEAKQIVAIGNTFVGSKAAIAFVGSEECVASWNTIYRPTAWVLRILQENRRHGFVTCRDGAFRGNLVVWRWRELHTAVNIGTCTAPHTFRFGSNWWYCEDRPSQSRPELPVPDHNGVVGRDPRLAVDGLTITAGAAPGHGAHAPRAATEFANFGPKLAPWAYKKHRETE